MKIIPYFLGLGLLAYSAYAETSLTIYNHNFGVVREILTLDLKEGENNARFSGVTAHLEPDSVILRDLAGQVKLTILEQNYRSQVVSAHLLMKMHEGKEIEFYVKEPNKPDRIVKGRIIRGGGDPQRSTVEPVIEVDGRVRLSLPGEPIFPALEDNAILKPMLEWQLHADKAGPVNAQLGYVTAGVSWEATYNVVGPEHGDTMDLVSFITVANNSGTDFNNASLQFVAGDVAKLPSNPLLPAQYGIAFDSSPPRSEITSKTLDEFHLYSFPRRTTVHHGETKQVEFVRASGIAARRSYVYDGADLSEEPGWRNDSSFIVSSKFGTRSQRKVSVIRTIENTEANRLGMPLPKGRVRFYRQDSGDRLQFTGEDQIDHTARNELLRLNAGAAFDLVGERKQTDFKEDSASRSVDETFEVKVRNRKPDEAVEICVVEHLYRWRQWEIRHNSAEFQKTDAQTIEFKVTLKPGEERVIRYTAHYGEQASQPNAFAVPGSAPSPPANGPSQAPPP